ncbi:MAG: nuclear transport factor 2 family protein [Acidobacteriia bacterium]|nr:nuclear transport factor 2 family protein [Terriglobia bacterium]
MTNTEVVLAFVNAINRRDVEMLCRLMTDDHLFVDAGGAQYRGRETMRSGWRGYFSMVPDYTIEVQEAVADGPVVIVVGTARGTYSPDGNLNPVDRWSTPGAWRAVVASGHVSVWQVFADNEPIRKIMRRYGKETA